MAQPHPEEGFWCTDFNVMRKRAQGHCCWLRFWLRSRAHSHTYSGGRRDRHGTPEGVSDVPATRWPGHCRQLDGVGGPVFTRAIEHTFEHDRILLMREVLV